MAHGNAYMFSLQPMHAHICCKFKAHKRCYSLVHAACVDLWIKFLMHMYIYLKGDERVFPGISISRARARRLKAWTAPNFPFKAIFLESYKVVYKTIMYNFYIQNFL